MKKNIKIIVTIVFFATLFSVGHFVWNKTTSPAEHSDVEAGVLNLNQNLIKSGGIIDLDGEWAFYPGELLSPREVAKRNTSDFIQVPSSWKTSNLPSKTAHGSGTYALSIPADELQEILLSFRINKINTAYKIYVNDDLISQLGQVDELPEKVTAERKPEEISFIVEEPTIDIVIQVSNFTYEKIGGIVNSLLFGTADSINDYSFANKALQIATAAILFSQIIYALIIATIGIARKQALLFALAAVFFMFSVLVEDDYLLLNFVDMSYETLIHVSNFIYSGSILAVFLVIIIGLKSTRANVKIAQFLFVILSIQVTAFLFLPITLERDYIYLHYIPWIITAIYLLFQLLKLKNHVKKSDLILIIIAITSIITSGIWTAIKNEQAFIILYYPFDLIITVIAFGVYLIINIFEATKRSGQIENALLQAQIEPHFIFNTLNSIISLSYIDQERMVKLLRNFANYLRFGFKEIKLDRLVLIKEELETVRAYIEIQKERFPNQINVKWDVDASLGDVKIPALTIQPLVENVIVHSILSDYKSGLLSIKVKKNSTHVNIEVSDDGPGVSKEKLASLLTETNELKRGVGLKNTHERLKNMYKTGLTITSAPGEGFKVSFRIPLKHGKIKR